MKHILSVESSSDEGWLSLKALTEAIDRYVAAQGSENTKPQAHAIGYSGPKSPKPQHKTPQGLPTGNAQQLQSQVFEKSK